MTTVQRPRDKEAESVFTTGNSPLEVGKKNRMDARLDKDRPGGILSEYRRTGGIKDERANLNTLFTISLILPTFKTNQVRLPLNTPPPGTFKQSVNSPRSCLL